MLFKYPWMQENVATWAKQYAKAPAYPHIVLDLLAYHHILEAALHDFPSLEDPRWIDNTLSNRTVQGKQTMSDVRRIPPSLRAILYEMNSGPFIEFLEQLTGIDHLLPDPHLHGAGLHQTLPGGTLNVHVDHNINTKLNLYRRVSVAFYLNKGWKDEYGGHFEVWTDRCVDRIVPHFNRMAIFTNSTISYHGHPMPVACPDGMTRKSLATWYLSATPHPSYSDTPHMARFLNQPSLAVVFDRVMRWGLRKEKRRY